MALFRVAICAALLLVTGTLALRAQDVTLSSPDGTVEITGNILGFDGEYYRVDTKFGELTVDGSGVTCEGQYSDGNGGDEFNASHILVESEEDAEEIRAELEEGADFATTARERSTGPSGPNGGELGWFTKGRMVPEFEEAVIALSAGEISAPVQTQFGWHVIKLNERRKSAAPEFAEIRDQLAAQIREEAVEESVRTLTTEAEIERPEIEDLDPAILKDLDLVRN